jgi:hypothetical protein
LNMHTAIQLQLYDYLQGGLTDSEREAVASHLCSCRACTEELEAIRALTDLQRSAAYDAAATRPPEFWNELLEEVDRRIAPQQPSPAWYQRVADWFTPGRLPQRRLALGFAALLIVASSALITWTVLRQDPRTPVLAEKVSVPPTVHAEKTRLQKYLRKSRTLLVGVANMKVPEDEPADLRAERETSRALVSEARLLRQEPMDVHSAQLINDLEKIQIELANMGPESSSPGVALIRHGIESNNLIFKIRMAESVHQQVHYAK